eukprot:9902330-Alexandrium_andersonii.AAC.1
MKRAHNAHAQRTLTQAILLAPHQRFDECPDVASVDGLPAMRFAPRPEDELAVLLVHDLHELLGLLRAQVV